MCPASCERRIARDPYRPYLIFFTTCLLGLSGCSVVGPASIDNSRATYNLVIEKTNSEQLLLNLVRLKYGESPTLLQVVNIATQFQLDASGQSSINLIPSNPDSGQVLGRVSYQERPTITYRPVEGQAFVQQMLSPISEQSLLLLYHAGWPIDKLFRLTVQDINGLPNAPSASGPTPETLPNYSKFLDAADALGCLQKDGGMILGVTDNGTKSAMIEFKRSEVTNDEIDELIADLRLDPEEMQYVFTRAVNGGGDQIAIITRPLLSTMFYLSQAVETPEDDIEAGRVTVTRDENGHPFDWQNVLGDLFQVHSSEKRPENASVEVRYRGHWFFIDDSDLASKSTFSLLTQLLALQSGNVKSSGPILTLPLGGR